VVNDQDAPQILNVFLHDRFAGVLSYDGSIYQFTYDDLYLQQTDALPLSLSLPLHKDPQRGAFGGKQLPPYFFHLLPEGWLLSLAKSLKMPVSHPMDLLSLLVVETIGAIRILQTTSIAPRQPTTPDMEPLMFDADPAGAAVFVKKHKQCLYCGAPLVSPGLNDNYHPKCSTALFGSAKTPRLTIDRSRIREVASAQLGRGESLTGVQEKFSLKHRKDRTTIAAPLSSFVAKPQPLTPDLSELSNLEGAYMLFARMLDLPVAGSGIIYLADGTPCFISRRFDLSDHGQRIHQEDLAAPLGRYNKYESSHEGIANLLVANTSIAEDRNHQDRVNFLKMTLFNFLLGNTDAHLKNFALFHTLEKAGPAHRLTPFYDIFPSLLYAPRDTDELGLSLVNRKNRFTKKDFQTLASRLQLGARSVSAFVKRFKDSRDALIQALDAYEVTQPRQYAVLDLAKRRLDQLND